MAARTPTVPLPDTSVVPTALAGLALAGAVLASLALSAGSTTALLALALVPATAAALVDRRHGRVPDALVLATALVPAALVAVGATGSGGVVAGAAVTAAPLLAVHLVQPVWMGFGDVKLAAALGAVLAPVDPRAGLVAVAVASALTLAVALARRRPAVPFAPGLVAGASVALVALSALGWEAPRWR